MTEQKTIIRLKPWWSIWQPAIFVLSWRNDYICGV